VVVVVVLAVVVVLVVVVVVAAAAVAYISFSKNPRFLLITKFNYHAYKSRP
jgi:hypothetical protein